MNHAKNECSRCGAKLPHGDGDEACQKCLLEIGLESGTDFSLGNLAETLPHCDEASEGNPADLRNNPAGLGRYRDLQAVHDWSYGTVYRAFHEGLQRFVRLRVLESSADDDERREFLLRAEKLSHIHHAHTVATLEAGVDRGAAYVAEEWIDGTPIDGFLPRSRRERWAEGFFPNAKLIRVMRDAAKGLDAIHQAGLTHDRIDPGSIVCDSGGIVKLIGLGEASESIDDRFAMPANSLSDSPSGERAKNSVAADLFRLGAVFCFLTTGKLPRELDANLNAQIFSRRLKQLNPGLRLSVCRVIADCIACPSYPTDTTPDGSIASTSRDKTAENPCESATHDDRSGYASASEMLHELNRLSQTDTQRSAWPTRIFSVYLESFCCFLILGLIFSKFTARYEDSSNEAEMPAATSIFLLPLLYGVVFETLLGWTIVRRMCGMRLLDHAGERSKWWQRLWRAVQKSFLLLLLIALPTILVTVLAMELFAASPTLTFVLLPICTLVMPLLGLYLPSIWIPSRWTSYDLASGVTWGEETRNVSPQDAERVLAKNKPSPSSSPTSRMDQYELYESLGKGGMGQVFRGRDSVLGREVAIKLLSGPLIENPLLLERFQREARLAAKVNHPGVAKVFGTGIWNRTPYIAMELVPGCNLQERIKDRGKISLRTAWDYATQAAEALSAADRSGVIHRDIKPANLMVTAEGRLKVTDFGVSRGVGLVGGGETPETSEPGMTDVGTIVGTPAYMAPEQAMGKEVDRRSDMYSLGMTLYHMLSGHAPFQAKGAVEMLAQQMSETPPTLFGQVDGLTPDQWSVVERMIAKQPSERYSTYEDLLADFQRHSPSVDRLANPFKRMAAQVAQWVAGYLALMLIVFLVSLGHLEVDLSQYDSKTLFGYLMLFLSSSITAWLVFSTARWGTPPAKRLLGLRIVRPDGRPLGLYRSFLRLVVAYPLVMIYVPRLTYRIIARAPGAPLERYLMLCLLLLQIAVTIISIIMMWVRVDRKTLHDLAADSIVVNDERFLRTKRKTAGSN